MTIRVILLLLLLCSGCRSASEVVVDSDSGKVGTDGGTGRDDSENGDDSGSDSDNDSNGTDNGDDSEDGDVMVTQTPISFRIRNATSETLYVHGDYMNEAVALEYSDGRGRRGSDEHLFYSPFCTMECSDGDDDSDDITVMNACCVECSIMPPSLEVLAPGADMIISSWNGYAYSTSACNEICLCYNKHDRVLAGTVLAEICAFTEYTCWYWDTDVGCTQENNHIHTAEGSGTPLCFSTEFALPTTDTEIEIVLGE